MTMESALLVDNFYFHALLYTISKSTMTSMAKNQPTQLKSDLNKHQMSTSNHQLQPNNILIKITLQWFHIYDIV